MRKFNWVGCILAAGLGGCSLYPIPDDVSPFRTEQIVRYGRCEVRQAVLDHMIRRGMITEQMTTKDIGSLIEATKKKEKANPKSLTENENQLLRLTKVAIVYSYDFNITEKNNASAGAGFRFPWSTGVLDAGGSAALDLTRVGSRVFGTEDDWDELITKSSLCDQQPWHRPANVLYPLTGSIGFDSLTGSIGVGRVVETFIDIDLQGGAKDNFVDTLTFTTSVSGDANASVKLDPVPEKFRLVSANAAIGASRLDTHKLTVSLAFPQPAPIPAITGVVRAPGDLNAPPFLRSPAWRARYNLCVQDARTRESSFKQLRLTDPLVYCITYADAFRYADQKVAVTVSRAVRVPAAPGAGESAPRTRIEQQIITRPVRPNYLPPFQ
jgi:hypothetical protein